MAILGIDLGTSNSAASIAVGDEVRMIEPAEGATDEGMVFPSYVAFDTAGNMSCVGLPAKRQFQTAADLVIRHAKRLIGRSYDYLGSELEQVKAGGRGRRFLDEFLDRIERGDTGEVLIRVGKTYVQTYTPQDIARFLLEKIRTDAEPQVHSLLGKGITSAVITVPAGFDDAPLRATMWAGEQVFGEGKVQLIPEPLAAAIASGVQSNQETIMVVDMGAGTTDIVVGSVIRTAGSFQWVPITQSCDDELGGWDMDGLILEHLLNADRKEPVLRDLYPYLDHRARGRLMEAIERAKIACASTENGQISVVLEAQVDGQSIRKPVMFNLDSRALKSIVAYKGQRSYEDKGSVVERCRKLVEATLLELADGNFDRVTAVKQSMDRVIMVGGPMRMRALYDMMTEVFTDKPIVLQNFDPLNPFPMECVARGAGLYQGGKIVLQVPHTLSIYDWGKGGYVNLIPRGTPYEGMASATADIEVEEGATWVDIITEKENVSLSNYPVREHIVRIPQHGSLRVTLHWDTGGCRVVFSGAGISPTEIPSINDQTTLGEDFRRQFLSIFQAARNLRTSLTDPKLRFKIRDQMVKQVVAHAPPEVQMMYNLDHEAVLDAWEMSDGQTLRKMLDKQISSMLSVPQEELDKCENLDPPALATLKEDEIRLMLDKGYLVGAKERVKARGLSENIFELTRLVRNLSRDTVSVTDLVDVTKTLLRAARKARLSTPLTTELKDLLEQLQKKQSNRVIIANVSIRAAALADVLHDQGVISELALRRVKGIAANADT
ncbi:MAG: Hsp70 family protein [Armatimonadota bacterium]